MKSQILSTKCKLKEKIFISLLGISLFITSIKLFLFNPLTLRGLAIFSILGLLFSLFTFLAYIDLKRLEVDRKISSILLIFFLTLNVVLFIIRNDFVIVINNWEYIPYQNILGAIALGTITQLIVLLTKEKGLGQGDVRISMIVGLLIGFDSILYWSYISVFTALIYGSVFALKEKKKLKGLKIPFVPFMILGVIIIVLISL